MIHRDTRTNRKLLPPARGGGDAEIFERRAKKLVESYQDLRVHHPSLPPDLHPFQVMKLNEQDQMA